MAKQKTTTKSTKRYRYSSFKEKIDDLKIEPARNLEKRVHDYVETSHFLASYQHWRDINMSADFTKFADDVESMIQTLPQILYHADEIFALLENHINKHDEKSLQPLTDLLSQFCHDLGPDFMKYYTRAVMLLIGLLESATSFESANVFEWGFNSLAYIFKYLSRVLSHDLLPTFALLFPLLSHKKEYLSRFSAEALSFLIRKSHQKNLQLFVDHTLSKLCESENDNLYDGMQTLFGEAVKSTSGALHSKSNVIFQTLLEVSFHEKHSYACISLLSDILMDTIRYALPENVIPLYELINTFLLQELDQPDNDVNKTARILSTCFFSESGKKVPNWAEYSSLLIKLLEHKNSSKLEPDMLAFTFSVFLRNSDLKTLTSLHKRMFEFYMTNFPAQFIEFFRLTLDVAKDKVLSFNCFKYLQKYALSNWNLAAKKLALLFLDLEFNMGFDLSSHFSTPVASKQIMSSIPKALLEDDSSVLDIFWNLLVINPSKAEDLQLLTSMLNRFLLREEFTDFHKDFVGFMLKSAYRNDTFKTNTLLDVIIAKFDSLKDSKFFLRGFSLFLSGFAEAATSDLESILLPLTDNLLLPDRSMRSETINLIITIMERIANPVPQIYYDLGVLEQIPLDLNTSRDITLRIRKLGSDFGQLESSNLLCNIFFKHLFGMLTARFSPIWEGINEVIPLIYEKDSELVWSICMKFINIIDENQSLSYLDLTESSKFSEPFWTVSINRLNDSLISADVIFKRYLNLDSSLLKILKANRGERIYPSLIRGQILKILLSISPLAERHSRDIIPFLFNEEESEEIFSVENNDSEIIPNACKWTDSDRNSLLKLVGKFKNIKSIYKSADVYDRFMILLSSRTTEVQRLALNALFAYKNQHINKYRDNLKNLLDDTLFKDETTKFLANDDSTAIHPDDEEHLMPIVLRILFGRAQTPVTSGIKKSRKTAVITVLPNLKDKYLISFFEIASSRFKYDYFFENGNVVEASEVTSLTLRKALGFINVTSSALSVLGSNFGKVIKAVIRPLIYSVSIANLALTLDSCEEFLSKIASNVRSSGMKCFFNLFTYLGESLDWSPFVPDIFKNLIIPRLPKFEDENLQQPSSILKIIVHWSTQRELYSFLYFNELSAVHALMKTMQNNSAKESVIAEILKFSNNILNITDDSDSYVQLVISVVGTCVKELPRLLQNLKDQAVVTSAVDLLFNITELGYVEDNENRKLLVDCLTLALEKDLSHINIKSLVKMLRTLSSLIEEYDCSFADIESLYTSCSKLYRVYADKELRESLNKVFVSIGSRFAEYEKVAVLLESLNSYSSKRINEYDFERRLPAFKGFHEDFKAYTELQWLPILYCALFFINDLNELAIRTNAAYTLKCFVEYLNEKSSVSDARLAVGMMKDIVLPSIRSGLRKDQEEIQNEYITVLSFIVTKTRYLPEIEDMKILHFNGDEEADFFLNINHIQIHRRQRAIRRLKDHVGELSDNSVSHYLMPMVERYVFSQEEKYRNIGNEAIVTIGLLANFISWNQYKALLRRYISMLKNKQDHLKEVVLLIVNLSTALKNTMQAQRFSNHEKQSIRKFPKKLDEVDSFVRDEIYEILSKILSTRDDETIISRVHLSEALVNFLLCLEPEQTLSLLPGILTSVCQVLRSRSEELREAIRKNLGNLVVILGPNYLSFVIKELKAALTRGSQIHVLSYSLHYILVSMTEHLKHGDLDNSADMIVKVIMEDVFGMAGQEKDAEGYTSKMKEVKFNKSYDTGEILSSNISLPVFGSLLHPIKTLLKEHLTLKTQNKLNELLRRYALGLNHNEESSSPDVLRLCYEVYKQSEISISTKKYDKGENLVANEKEEFFLVKLDSKPFKVQTDDTTFIHTLQKFSLDLLKTAITKNPNLLEVSYLDGFIPLMKETLVSSNEGVVISTLRVLTMIIKLDFKEESEGIFKNCARKVLDIIRDSPSTSSELCQMGLKFLSVTVRHKNIKLKESALSYVLGRIQPDLMEPSKQGLAFNFVKALISKHIVLPELYDLVDNIAEIMITNHSKDIRDVSRGVYYHFLMEYDQSKGRLEKQFKFMLNNLQYPSQDGRQSVLELLNLIISKSGPVLLKKLSSSFFVALAEVCVQDDAPKCREMASVLISNLIERLGDDNLGDIRNYITVWLKQTGNEQFINLGLKIYKLHLSKFSPEKDTPLDSLGISRIQSILANVDADSDSSWDTVYTCLGVFEVYASKSETVFSNEFEKTWKHIIKCLLYPHSWVRLSASRLINYLLNNFHKLEFSLDPYTIQTIAYRIFRLLGAPGLPESLASVSLKTLVLIIMKWKKENSPFISVSSDGSEAKYTDAIEFAIIRTGAIIRSEDNRNGSFRSKKAAIQLFALMMQVLDEVRLAQESEKFLMSLYMYLEATGGSLEEEEEELHNLAQECLKILETKVSVSEFTKAYANVKQAVIARRQERKAKRAVLAVRAPDVAANRKLKKHARSREKRSHERDENGYYHRKNKKRRS